MARRASSGSILLFASSVIVPSRPSVSKYGTIGVIQVHGVGGSALVAWW